jgi:hypothetical protein
VTFAGKDLGPSQGKIWALHRERFGTFTGKDLGPSQGKIWALRKERFGPSQGKIWALRKERFGPSQGKPLVPSQGKFYFIIFSSKSPPPVPTLHRPSCPCFNQPRTAAERINSNLIRMFSDCINICSNRRNRHNFSRRLHCLPNSNNSSSNSVGQVTAASCCCHRFRVRIYCILTLFSLNPFSRIPKCPRGLRMDEFSD